MKFNIPKNDFLKGLQVVQSVVEKKDTMPILSNVLIQGKGDEVVLIATDLQIGIKKIINISIEKEGEITVSARKLYEIVRELPDTIISVEQIQNNRIKITCNEIMFQLIGSPTDEFPSFPVIDQANFIEIKENIIKEMIEKTIFAVSLEDTRYNLSGTYVERLERDRDTFIRMVATDGHRLSLIDRKLDEKLPLEKGIIVPRKGFNELKKLLGDTEENLRIGFLPNSCIFIKENLTMVIRLIEGDFPNYRDVIPKSNPNSLIIERSYLLEAIRRISLLSSERFRGIKLELNSGELKLLSRYPELGEAHERLSVAYDGEPLTIGFNGRYLIEALNAISAEKIVMEFKDESSPAVVKNPEDPLYLGLIMPMRL